MKNKKTNNTNNDQSAARRKVPVAKYSGAPPSVEDEFRRLRAEYQNVPDITQLRAMEQLAGRLVVESTDDGAEIDEVKSADEPHRYKDKLTGNSVDPAVVSELLQQADRYSWLLDDAQLYQAGIVSRIPPGSDWRTLSAAQHRSLTAWRTQHPELTYANLLTNGPINARVRLHLHQALTAQHTAAGAKNATPAPAPQPEKLADRMSRVEAALNGLSSKLRNRKTTGANDEPQIVRPTQPHQEPTSAPQLDDADGAPIVAPDHTYIEVDNIDEATWNEIVGQGLRPPETANGFIKLDPYGTTYTLADAVIFYFDKIELQIPDGHLPYLVKHLAFYNNLIKVVDRELQAGQYLWFPDRTVLDAWAHERIPTD